MENHDEQSRIAASYPFEERGTGYGDSGGPTLLNGVAIAVVSIGDVPCWSTQVNPRTDTEEAADFLRPYLALTHSGRTGRERKLLPPVFDHVTIRVADIAASRRFYSLALGEPTHDVEVVTAWGDFDITSASVEKPPPKRLHIGFGAHDRDEVDRWWEELTAAGYESDGIPGVRPWYHPSYYGAFVLDPDGNSIEYVHHHKTTPEASRIDHLWLRTRDVDGAKRFYETIAPVVGIELVLDTPDRVRFSDGVGSFSFVQEDEPTENVHYAFGVGDRAAVDEFHRVAISAGYRDNGAPGERPQYHPGYYGAFVLDPDGHNVEAVFHDR